MRCVLGYDVNHAVAAVVVSCAVAGAFSAMTRPSSADTANPTSISVNRALKGDKLAPTETLREKRNALAGAWNAIAPASASRRTLVGCDPMFSVMADPELTQIYRRCDA